MFKGKWYFLVPALIASLPVMVDYNIVGTDFLLYMAKVEEMLGFVPDASYRWFILLINIATAGIAFWSFMKCFDNAEVGLLGCALYTLSPYRLSMVYSASAIGEYVALVFMPLLVLGCYGIACFKHKEKGYVWNWVVLVAGLVGTVLPYVLTHEIQSQSDHSMLKIGFWGVGSALLLCIMIWFGLVLFYGNAELTKEQRIERRVACLTFVSSCILIVGDKKLTGVAIIGIIITACVMMLWIYREKRSILPPKAVLYVLVTITLVFGTYQVNQILLTSTNIR